MDAGKLMKWLLFVLLAFMLATPVFAQTTLEFNTPVEGHIDAGGTQDWSFAARDGMVISIIVQTKSPNLDPVVSLRTSADTELIANDDYAYPDSKDAILQAITIPFADTFTVRVSGHGNSTGDYTLTLLHGFAQLTTHDDFNGQNAWQAAEPANAVSENGELTLSVAGVQQMGIAQQPKAAALADFYVQTQVTQITGRAGWSAGVMIRQVDSDNYAMFVINDQGLWRFLAHSTDGTRVVRDWTVHPALVAGETSFSLGIMANGSSFDLFYNGLFVGQVVDNSVPQSGRVGVMVGTPDAIGSETVARFDDLVITTPIKTNGKEVIPQQLLSNTGGGVVQELQRRRAIPNGGEMALRVPESSAENVHPGVTGFSLARGSKFTNFVLGTQVTWTIGGSAVAGCGLIFRQTDNTHYTLAYIDQTGGYGVSLRDGGAFQAGIFAQKQGWGGNNTHALVVVANDTTLYYYIDGNYVGTLKNPPSEGTIENAVVNFESVDTSCEFTDTWLWRWK
jgi:hypothetical protein